MPCHPTTIALYAPRVVSTASHDMRPVAGPLNYNPVEEFFFHRIKAGRPICVPNSGQQVVSASCFMQFSLLPANSSILKRGLSSLRSTEECLMQTLDVHVDHSRSTPIAPICMLDTSAADVLPACAWNSAVSDNIGAIDTVQ